MCIFTMYTVRVLFRYHVVGVENSTQVYFMYVIPHEANYTINYVHASRYSMECLLSYSSWLIEQCGYSQRSNSRINYVGNMLSLQRSSGLSVRLVVAMMLTVVMVNIYDLQHKNIAVCPSHQFNNVPSMVLVRVNTMTL